MKNTHCHAYCPTFTTFMAALSFLLCVIGSLQATAHEPRTFVHPGISYTQADIDRMKAQIAAREEPWYSTFVALKNSSYSSLSGSVTERGNQIAEGEHNGTIGADGRRAHDLALLYVLTGDVRYADKAVNFLNANSHYTNVSSRGTGPLDGGKINLLIEAAELLRDYPGWAPEDQQRFKDMLVYPGYSTTINHYKTHSSLDDSKNAITFYWNCYDFDSGRWGNQGMFAARALLAMGVYLDNDTIFDRAYQYLNGTQWKHFENYSDLDYKAGPMVGSGSISANDQYGFSWSNCQQVSTGDSRYVRNYGYGEQLQYYIFKNGQCQESCRDQGHTLCGISMYSNLAEQCWNQGEDLWGALDNRILKGWEYNVRVNLSGLADYSTYMNDKDWTGQWRPTAYSVKKPTADWDPRNADLSHNIEPESADTFYQTWHRCGRWFYKDLTTSDAGDRLGSSGCREMTYAHYHVRMGMADADMKWLKRYREYLIKKYKYENWGMDSGHHYEWCGWGTLTKYRREGWAGDPVSYQTGKRVPGIHGVFEEVWAADYDWTGVCGQGHTYFKSHVREGYMDEYRPGELVETTKADGRTVVTAMGGGDWLTYTFSIPSAGTYPLTLRYAAGEGSPMITIIADGEYVNDVFCENTYGEYTDAPAVELELKAGVHVLKIQVEGEDADFRLSTLKLESIAPSYGIALPEGVSGHSRAIAGQSVTVTGDERVGAGTLVVYDPTTDSRLAMAGAGSRTVSFDMPSHDVEVTCVRAPEGGMVLLGTIATNTAGVGSAFARANHPDVFTFDIPADASNYATCTYTHPYKNHNYNRKNLRLVCPDNTVIPINDTYEGPWDISGHIIPGTTNTLTLLNDHENGIDYWANGIATKAELLTVMILSDPVPEAIRSLDADKDSMEEWYDLSGRRLYDAAIPKNGIFIHDRKLTIVR